MSKSLKTKDLAYMGLSVAIIAVCSWISLPIGEVPFTLQTLAVCLIAGLLGLKRGVITTIVYLLLGAIGVPVFASFSGGFSSIVGPTGGYLIGFIFTALIVGFVSDKFKGKMWALVLSMIVGILVCYAFGTAWFAIVYVKQGTPMALADILGFCVIPFLIPDAVKIVIASVLTNRLKKHIK